MQKGPDQFGSKSQEILILLPNLNVSKIPYPSHALSWSVCLGQGCMGCHPMLTKNANFVTNALRGDLSTLNVRPWCGHYTFSLLQWIGNWILPQFDPSMSSPALLEPEIPSPLDVKGKNNVDFFWSWWWLLLPFFMYGCGRSDCG